MMGAVFSSLIRHSQLTSDPQKIDVLLGFATRK